MFFQGLGTAAPARRFEQRACWETLVQSRRFHEFSPRSRAILKKVLNGNSGIGTRHLVLERLEQAFELTPDVLHARFLEHAPLLATQAATRALADAAIGPDDIDALIISTCTGYLCPGLTSYVSQRLGLRPETLALDLVGQGCGAAVPNLRMAEALLRAGRGRRVLSVCVEVCSAALYFDDDPGVLISACLFGDGAGAAVLSTTANPRRPLQWLSSASSLQPADRDLLRFEQRAGMLRNILSPEVPARAALHAGQLLESVMDQGRMDRSLIRAWLFHPGGRDVLFALREKFGLSEADLRWSTAVLHEFGNVSSASLFFVLEAAFADSAPEGLWWMSSFGAGFSCHGALLEFGGS